MSSNNFGTKSNHSIMELSETCASYHGPVNVTKYTTFQTNSGGLCTVSKEVVPCDGGPERGLHTPHQSTHQLFCRGTILTFSLSIRLSIVLTQKSVSLTCIRHLLRGTLLFMGYVRSFLRAANSRRHNSDIPQPQSQA